MRGDAMNFLLFIPILILILPAYAQEAKNPSLIIETVEIPPEEFNITGRDSAMFGLNQIHAISWQITMDNNLLYANPDGNAVIRLYDEKIEDKFIEVGMGGPPDKKFWVAVQIPDDEGYVVVHSKIARGWSQDAKTVVSYTDRAGMTVNNGARIVVSNLDIEEFAVSAYSVFGMESSADPPAVNSGVMIVEFLSGDPGKNIFAFFPFYVTAVVGAIAGILFLTKKAPKK